MPRRLEAARLMSLVAVIAVWLYGPTTAVAQTVQSQTAGPLVFKNTTDSPLTVTVTSYLDYAGRTATLNAEWSVPAKYFGHLLVNKEKVSVRQVTYRVTTPDGTTHWASGTTRLDSDGDFVALFSDETLAEHRRLLGKPAAPVVAAFRPAAPAGPTEEQVVRGVLKVIGAAALNEAAKPQADDGFIQAALREGARTARDEVFESALGDLFPALTPREAAAARRFICLALDGELTVNQFTRKTAKEDLIRRLKEDFPDAGLAAEVADFVVRVADRQGK